MRDRRVIDDYYTASGTNKKSRTILAPDGRVQARVTVVDHGMTQTCRSALWYFADNVGEAVGRGPRVGGVRGWRGRGADAGEPVNRHHDRDGGELLSAQSCRYCVPVVVTRVHAASSCSRSGAERGGYGHRLIGEVKEDYGSTQSKRPRQLDIGENAKRSAACESGPVIRDRFTPLPANLIKISRASGRPGRMGTFRRNSAIRI